MNNSKNSKSEVRENNLLVCIYYSLLWVCIS